MVDRAVPLVRRRLGEGDLLDVTNVGGAEKYLASPHGAAGLKEKSAEFAEKGSEVYAKA